MCGIVGYVGHRPALNVLLQGLKRLEYRGYDSAGVALQVDRHLEIRKSEGRLENVEKLVNGKSAQLEKALCGIGHTRWATHGKPTTQNAHPHKTGHVALVHNGIIENYLEIKKTIRAKGFSPVSETDSELFGFLVLAEMDQGSSLAEAVRKSFSIVRGQCSVVVVSEKEPHVVVGVRNGSPLVVTRDSEGGTIIASDPQPLLQYNKEVVFLDHGDMVVAKTDQLNFFDVATGKPITRNSTRLDWSVEKLDKAGFPHYMLKEIHEQPITLVETLNGILDRSKAVPYSFASQPGVALLEKANEFILVACGTSWHAALLGKYWIELLANIPVSVELASEIRYRQPVIRPGALVIGISQSGETADTLAVLREMRLKGIPTLGISNVHGSSITREADAVFFTSAGPEIGVAATKTFLAQMLVLHLIGGFLGMKNRSENRKLLDESFEDLIRLPHFLTVGLETDSTMISQVKKVAESVGNIKGFFYVGRGYSFPLALEGALKLKEIAYDHAEGYAAGELKHGPIAMIDNSMAVVVLAPRDAWRDKTVSNLEEVKARGAKIIGVGDSEDADLISLCDHWISLPTGSSQISHDLLPFLLAPVIQLLSYYRAVLKGTDIDKPRNLAKSVTVE